MAKKILAVDDTFDDLETIKNILEEKGYEVTAVTNGEDALEQVSANGFDLILLNIIMPVMSGYDLLKKIRKQLKGTKKESVKIAYISITPENNIDMKGADGFIQKPYSPESLLEEVRRLLKK